MADKARARKLAERIQQVVATMLDTRVKDPRLGFVTITDVKVTGDLQHADVYYTVLGADDTRAGTAAALESAKGLIRSEVGKQTGIRLTPSLAFHADALPETAAHMDAALAEARRRDAEVERLRAGATYAGDADPYKTSGADDDDSDADEDTDDDTDVDAGDDADEADDDADEAADPSDVASDGVDGPAATR